MLQCKSNQVSFTFATCASTMTFSNWYIFVIASINLIYMINSSEQQLRVRIYSNLVEITQSMRKLPLEFPIDDWNDIVPESIILFGTNFSITSQSIVQKRKSSKGAQVYVRSPISTITTAKPLIRATIVDDDRYPIEVKVQNELVAGQTLYFTVSKKDIFYLTQQTDSIVQVDFTYNRSSSPIYVRYLRSGISWQAQYQLNIQGNRSDLFVFANIRNNLNSSLLIAQAKLVSKDQSFIMTNLSHLSEK